jgi:hypothetical protein
MISYKTFFAFMFAMTLSFSLWAGEAAKLVNLVGKAHVVKADKTNVELKLNDMVSEGDTIVTEKDTFAMFKFTDNAETILRPNSEFKIVEYKFVTDDPSQDKSVSNLVKGGLRRMTGLCGKRGNPDADKLITATATVGIRGTIYDVISCSGNCDNLDNGTYFRVKDGQISVKNDAGEQLVSAGQFAYSSSYSSKPVPLAKDPGLPPMNPPKSMQPNTSGSNCAA